MNRNPPRLLARLDRRELLAALAGSGLALRSDVLRTAPLLARAPDDRPPKGVPAPSESVYTDAVSADGQTGFVLRLCRYPDAGVSWSWGHAFHRGEVYAFTDAAIPCGAERTDLESPDASYSAERPGTSLSLERRGPRSRPERCLARSSFLAHRAAEPPHGDGDVRVRVEATFVPAHDSVSSLAGRTEVLGSVDAKLEIAGETIGLAAYGHFHEQEQTRPRWTAPFCYATLRGDGYQSVAIATERGAVGFVVREGVAARIDRFDIEPPSSATATTAPGARRFELGLEVGETISGLYRDTYVYSVPIYDVRRRGSVVAGDAAGRAVSGCVNDYLPERLVYVDATSTRREGV